MGLVIMPRKTATTPAISETAAVSPVAKTRTPRAAKTATQNTATVEVAVKPRTTQRVTTVKHSKAAAPAAVETITVETVSMNAHDQIAKIAYGYWEARGFQPGSPEQDWLRAEREYLLSA